MDIEKDASEPMEVDNPVQQIDRAAWRISQVKGPEQAEASPQEFITQVKFSEDGRLLLSGTKGGRVTVYCKNIQTNHYENYTEFQNIEHCPFKKMLWLRQNSPSQFILATKTSRYESSVELWKITENLLDSKKFQFQEETKIGNWDSKMKLPKGNAKLKRRFGSPLHNSISSISMNSDQETFLSACNKAINLWHLENTNEVLNIVDFCEMTNVGYNEDITSTQFHPSDCALFAFGSNEGNLRLCDLRTSVVSDKCTKIFYDGPKFLWDLNRDVKPTISIKDIEWSNSGRYIATRDYMSIQIYDINMNHRPIETYPIQNYFLRYAKKLRDEHFLSDSFECTWKPDDSGIMTGAYNNLFSIIDRNSNQVQTYQIPKNEIQAQTSNLIPLPERIKLDKNFNITTNQKLNVGDKMDLTLRVGTSSWNGNADTIALASKNRLFILQDRFFWLLNK